MKVFILIILLGAGLFPQSHKTIKVGIQNNPPQSYLDKGIPKGFVVDLMKDFALKNRYRVVFVKDKFTGLLSKITEGDIDVILPLAATEERSRYLLFTDESVLVSWMNIVVPVHSDVMLLSDLQDKVIGCTRGAYFLERLKTILKRLNLDCTFRSYDDYTGIFEDLRKGEIDSAFVGKHSFLASFQNDKDSGSKLRVVDSLFVRSLYIGVSANRGDLVDQLNTYLKKGKSRAGSSFNIIHQYWYGKVVTQEDLIRKNMIWIIVAVSIFLIVIFFNLILGNKVKRVTREINRQKLFFQNLLRNTPLGVVIFDESYKILEVNKAFKEMTGYKWRELKGRSVKELSGYKDSDEIGNIFASLEKEGRAFGEIKLKSGNRDQLDIQLGLSTVRIDKSTAGGVGIYVDITKLKDMEVKIARNRSLESIGILAGGIAHDFNNMLSGVIGNLSLARKIGDPSKCAGLLEKAEKAAVQTTGLAKQLLTFSKGGVFVKEVVSAESLVQDTLALILSGSSIVYKLRAEEKLLSIEGDVTQISQVLSNIVMNAKEAITETDGRIDVTLENFNAGKGDSGLKEGNYVRITIKDNGKGMEQEVIDNIFVPYYSTKEKGSGLGMAISYSIIKKHGGHIEVNSTPGEGTAFILTIPASKQSPEINNPGKDEFPYSMRVLLMDDEASVREVFSDILKYHGNSVDLASSSDEAIELYRRSVDENRVYDLVFLDLTVPGDDGGVETLQKIRQIDAGVVAIATSGYSSGDVFSNYRDYNFSDVLAKPFGAEELQEILTRYKGGTNIS